MEYPEMEKIDSQPNSNTESKPTPRHVDDLSETHCCGIGCLKTLCSRTPIPIEKYKVTRFEICSLTFALLCYIADVGSDIWVAVTFYNDGHPYWTGLTISFVIAPCIPGLIFVCLDICNYRSLTAIQIISITFPGGIIYLLLQDIFFAYSAMKHKREEDTEKYIERVAFTFVTRLLEAYIEAAPQMVLQLYIILKSSAPIAPIQWATVAISLVSLSLAIVAHYRANYRYYEKYNVSHPGAALCFGWHICTIWARVLALTTCAIYSAWTLIIFLCSHFLASIIFFMLILKRDTRFEWITSSCLNSFVALISSYTRTYSHPLCNRQQYCFLHILIYLENVCMLLLWYFSSKSDDAPLWLKYCASVSIIGVYPIGVFFQIVYYLDFHPKNFHEDNTTRITLFIPRSEWRRRMTVHVAQITRWRVEIKRWRKEIERWREDTSRDDKRIQRQEEKIRKEEAKIRDESDNIRKWREEEKARELTTEGEADVKRWEEERRVWEEEGKQWKEEISRWRDERRQEQEEGGRQTEEL